MMQSLQGLVRQPGCCWRLVESWRVLGPVPRHERESPKMGYFETLLEWYWTAYTSDVSLLGGRNGLLELLLGSRD